MAKWAYKSQTANNSFSFLISPVRNCDRLQHQSEIILSTMSKYLIYDELSTSVGLYMQTCFFRGMNQR